MATEAHLKGNKKYQETLDRIVFYVKKGEKEEIKAHAEKEGLSLNSYINQLIKNDIGKDVER